MVTVPLPEAFTESILNDSPFGEQLLRALNDEPPTSVRVNPRKKQAFHAEGLDPVPWCKDAYYLPKRPNFTLDPLFHAGVYYPQEAASMVIYSAIKALDLPRGCLALDACAAPGGKTLAMMDAMPEYSACIANEIHPHRSNVLSENVTKWGLDNVAVTNNDTSAFMPLETFFDLVLIDAPCSGEGMFRKDHNARSEWSPNSVKLNAERQTVIINNLMHCVKPGGYLMYSTCTFNRHENEARIQELLNTGKFELFPWEAPSTCTPGRNKIGHYFLQGKNRSEGLFVCILRRNGVLTTPFNFPKAGPIDNFTGIEFTTAKHHELIQQGHTAILRSAILGQYLERITHPFRYVKTGVSTAETTLKGWTPLHDLAMLGSQIPAIACSQQEALMYLRGETFPIPSYAAGFYTLHYQGVPLGFIKHLGHRFNNLYPKNWRIRMQLR